MATTLGQGSYAKVLAHQSEGMPVALKCYATLQDNGLSSAFREIEVMSHLNHPNIIEYRGYYVGPFEGLKVREDEEDGQLHIEMALAEKSLAKYLEEREGKVSIAEAKFCIAQILLALEYLQANSIIHRDLSTSNVLLLKDGRWCICDFGMSKYFFSDVELNDEYVHPDYRAPEMHTSSSYDMLVDVWSVGVIAQQLLTGSNPFAVRRYVGSREEEMMLAIVKNIPQCPRWDVLEAWFKKHNTPSTRANRVYESRLAGKKLPVCHSLSKGAIDFLSKALSFQRSHRASASELLDHPWLRAAAEKDIASHDDPESIVTSMINAAREHCLKRHIPDFASAPVTVPHSKTRQAIIDYIQRYAKPILPNRQGEAVLNRLCLSLNIFYRIYNSENETLRQELERGYTLPIYLICLSIAVKYYNTNANLDVRGLITGPVKNHMTGDYMRTYELAVLEALKGRIYSKTTYDILSQKKMRVSRENEDDVWLFYLRGATGTRDIEKEYEELVDAHLEASRRK